MGGFLAQATIYLGATVIAVPLAARLGLGSVLGYLAAGILIGPVLGLVGTETQSIQHFAEFGVVMMLFVIGLELSPKALWDMRNKLLGLGGAQVLFTIIAISIAGIALGLTWREAIAIGMIFSLSSTAIVLQTLTEKKMIQTTGGRSVFSVLLTQDIAVIPMLALLPFLATNQPRFGPDGAMIRPMVDGANDVSSHSSTLIDGMAPYAAAGITGLIIAGTIFVGIFLSRPVFSYIENSKLREMNTALALLIVIGISYIFSMVGLSPALGSFLAGVVLANTEFRHELVSDIEPFKGLLLGLFFITVGAGINFEILFNNPFVILSLTFGLIITKALILYMIATTFKLKPKSRWLFSLSLAQAGEFGFVLISFGSQQNVLPSWLEQQGLLIVALSMLITPALFICYDLISKNRQTHEHSLGVEDEIDDQGTVIIAGIGRFGQIVSRLIQSSGFKTVVLDNNLQTIQLMRRFGMKAFFGDPSRHDLLHAAGLAQAKVLVVAIDDPQKIIRVVKVARAARPDIHIIARAIDRRHVYELHEAGANDIVRELFDSSLRAGRYALENMGLTEFEASEAQRVFYRHDRSTILELAQLWQNGLKTGENEAYIKRAKELDEELEAALITMMEKAASKTTENAR